MEIPQIANSNDRSVHRFVIQVIKSLASTEDREISFTLCRRSQNKVSHELLLMAVVPPNRSVVVLGVRLHCKLGCG